MLRIHGDTGSLLAALAAHWADQQLQIPAALKAGGTAHPKAASAAALNGLNRLQRKGG